MRIEYSRSGTNERGRDRSRVEAFYLDHGEMLIRLIFETRDGVSVVIELDQEEAKKHLDLMRVMAS